MTFKEIKEIKDLEKEIEEIKALTNITKENLNYLLEIVLECSKILGVCTKCLLNAIKSTLINNK